eukprot:GILJ01005256.1.p1 GENE.GILJ01005256.1~~GILJ01005256.1.p1  ORF type:complete len:442 (+),score=52.36 GILJ01005256.1:229-1554(+)
MEIVRKLFSPSTSPVLPKRSLDEPTESRSETTDGPVAVAAPVSAPTTFSPVQDAGTKAQQKKSLKAALLGYGADKTFCWFSYLNTPHFEKGKWGNFELAKDFMKYVQTTHPPSIEVEWQTEWQVLSSTLGPHEVLYREGSFECPVISGARTGTHSFAHILPPQCHVAHIRWIMPVSAFEKRVINKRITYIPSSSFFSTGVTVLLSATGQEGYQWRTDNVAVPLARESQVGTVILENPFYGKRRATYAESSGRIYSVSDLLAMGLTGIQEAKALLTWLHETGFKHLCVSGMSMGAILSLLTAVQIPLEVGVAAFLPAHSVAHAWTHGVLSSVICWDALMKDRKLTLEQAKELFYGILDETDIRRYPLPKAVEAAILVAAIDDAYTPADSAKIVHEHWVGSEMRYIPGGHVSAFVWYTADFRRAICDSLSKVKDLVENSVELN